jgi:large subunit ribosomal protein L9
MEVILLEKIERLGGLGDVVKVKNGFARNFLLPQKKALRATEANKAVFEKDRAALEAKNAEMKTSAEAIAEKIDGMDLTIIRQAGDTGQLYGSVSTRDIAEAASSDDAGVKRNQVILDKPIKILGLHPVRVSLHPEVSVSLTVNVARTEEEAARQAKGEDVTATNQEDAAEETIAVEEVFEDEAIAQQASEELSESPEEEAPEEAPTEEAAEEAVEEVAEEAAEEAEETKDD